MGHFFFIHSRKNFILDYRTIDKSELVELMLFYALVFCTFYWFRKHSVVTSRGMDVYKRSVTNYSFATCYLNTNEK